MAYVAVHLAVGKPPTRLSSGELLDELMDVGTANTTTSDQALIDNGTLLLGLPPMPVEAASTADSIAVAPAGSMTQTDAQAALEGLSARSDAAATAASAEAATRAAADSAEATTRGNADTTETSARTTADSSEATTRGTADTTEATARASGDSTEQTRALAAEALLAPRANPAFTDTAAFSASTVKAGGSSSNARVGGTLFTHFVDAPNGTTVETDLYSDSVPASALATNGDSLNGMYGGIIVQSGTATRQLKVYFGGTLIFDSGALSVSIAGDWVIEVLLVRVSATVVRAAVSMTLTGASLGAYANVVEVTGLTISGANVLKVTGQAAGVGAASADIVAQVATVGWMPA